MYELSASNSWIVEPYNAVSASLFIVVAVYWLIHAASVRHRFLIYASLVLLVGGIGGTLYHGLRSSSIFLALDVLPILILAVSAVYWFVLRMAAARWTAPVYTFGGLFAVMLTLRLIRTMYGDAPVPRGPVVGYGMLGVFVTVPMLMFVVRTKFQHARWVGLAIAAFVVGMYFRAVDRSGLLPMGTHFLWHGFGALMTHLLLYYLWSMRDVDLDGGRSLAVGSSP